MAGLTDGPLPPFPLRLELELTNRCNARCSYCPRRFGIGDEGDLDPALARRLLDEAAAYPATVVQLHRRGESLLHPQFTEILAMVRGRFRTVQLATNAVLLTGAVADAVAATVDFLSFSIDLPERFAASRGIDCYDLVERNILDFLARGAKAETQVSMVRTAAVSNDAVARFRERWQGRVNRIRVYEEHSVDGKFGATRQRRPERRPCVKPFTDLVIYWDGSVVRCNHDWSNAPLGSVREDTIAGVWHSAAFARLRDEQRRGDFTGICAECDSWYAVAGEQGTGELFTGTEDGNGGCS